ncbi:putative cytochrome-b5 reductase [Helianthus anomalus]
MDFLEEHEIPIVISVFSVSIVAFLLFSKKPKGCIDPDKYRDFKLVKRTQLSHNVAKFRFALPTPSSVLGLPIGQHIICRYFYNIKMSTTGMFSSLITLLVVVFKIRGTDSQGQEITKPYTPTTLDTDAGYFELVIKMYPQGRMSHHFREMKEGDYLSVKGPKGEFKYRPGDARAFGMLAGGSGITPMFQVARAILEDESDKTKLDLIYANVTVDDILLKASNYVFKEELDTLATKYYGRFKVYYVLEQPPKGWTGGVGFISKEMIEEHLPEPAFDIKVCFHPNMFLDEAKCMGWVTCQKEQVYLFVSD